MPNAFVRPGLALAGLARERTRIDLTMKKPGAYTTKFFAFRAVRGVCSSSSR
jgi:hypothetical protein